MTTSFSGGEATMEFEDLGLSIDKAEFESRRPSGRTVEINRPHWIARFKRVCELMERYHTQGSILEIGAYRYNLTTILKLKGYDVIGIDKNTEKMAEYIQQEDLDIRECDIECEKLPFEQDSFSTVLLTEVFEHLRINPLETLRNIREVMKSDGVLVLSTPNLYSIINVIDFFLGRGLRNMDTGFEVFKQLEDEGFPGHIRTYSESELREFLNGVGFEVEEILYAGLPRGSKGKLLQPVCRAVPKVRERVYVVATPAI